jgi:hypothetical protein
VHITSDGGMARVVEHLPSECKALSSNSSPANNNNSNNSKLHIRSSQEGVVLIRCEDLYAEVVDMEVPGCYPCAGGHQLTQKYHL